MEKAWEAVHKSFRSLCVQGGITVGGGARTGWCDSCLTLLDVCQYFWRDLCLGGLSSLCAWYACAILLQEQGKGAASTFPQSLSIAIFGTLIGITFQKSALLWMFILACDAVIKYLTQHIFTVFRDIFNTSVSRMSMKVLKLFLCSVLFPLIV